MEAPFQVPAPSIESGEQHGLFADSEQSLSSSASSLDYTDFGQKDPGGTPVLTDMHMAHLGFAKDLLRADPKALIARVRAQVDAMRARGQQVPVKTAGQIYVKLCGALRTAPIDIFSHIADGELRLNNYALNDTQTRPISFVLPVSADFDSSANTRLDCSSWRTCGP